MKFEFKIDSDKVRPVAMTAAVLLIAGLGAWTLWWHYMRAPWTRDGRVRAYVVDHSPEVSGTVVLVKVGDNQLVKKGDELFEIDPARYKLALAEAEAEVESRQAEMQVRIDESERRSKLGPEAVSPEEQRSFEATAGVAKGAYDQAVAARDVARLNLDRTIVRSTVNGYVSNLQLRVGDFAVAGQSRLSIIDSDSFWVVGYFEETKLPHVREGDRATITLMGVGPKILGHVESISRGISDENGHSDAQGLASVNPIFTWVRLAQRIPVRIHLDQVPSQVLLSAGMTCTVIVRN